MNIEEARNAIETLIFAASKPVSARRLSEILQIEERVVRSLVEDIAEEYAASRPLQLRQIAGGYEICTRPEYEQYVEALRCSTRPSPLSSAALETFAIVAYKQPVTKLEIENIRGVRVDSVINTLLERDLIEEAGRKDTVGRPILYRTTHEFLRYFGLRDIRELPEVYDLNEAGQ